MAADMRRESANIKNVEHIMWTCPKCRQTLEDNFEVCWACGTSMDGVENPRFFDEPSKPAVSSIPPTNEAPEHLVTVATCSLAVEAHAIRVCLESEGIPVFLFDEFLVSMDWLLSNAIGGVKVQIPDHDLERAQAILAKVEKQQAQRDRSSEEPSEGEQAISAASAQDDAATGIKEVPPV